MDLDVGEELKHATAILQEQPVDINDGLLSMTPQECDSFPAGIDDKGRIQTRSARVRLESNYFRKMELV